MNRLIVTWKSNGGLIIPTESVVKRCYETEKCIIEMMNSSSEKLPHSSGLFSAISTTVLPTSIGSNVFKDLTEHICTTPLQPTNTLHI